MRHESHLLINESPLQVLPSLATAIGLNEAIILQQLHYWLARSENERAGRKWVFNNYSHWGEQFPFWSARTIQRAFLNLERLGLVLTDQPGGSDRRKWYTIDYDQLAEIGDNMALSSRQSGTIPSRQIGTMNAPDWNDDQNKRLQQETTQEITQEEEGANARKKRDVAPNSPVSKSCDDDWLKDLSGDPTYSHVQVTFEFGKMQRWCEQHNKAPTRSRFVNWINRIERPMKLEGNGNGQINSNQQRYGKQPPTRDFSIFPPSA